MGFMLPFVHKYGNTVVEPTAVSAFVGLEPNLKAVKLTNSGQAICYVKLGSGTLIASTSDTPILPGESIILGKSIDDDKCAYISAVGTVLNIKEGEVGESCKYPS